ncbi:MAG: type II toxin-antitoxin system death-on-curing family toxin [Phycisphaerales bacterium]|nr:type II toxin-antitoxin system death-on-curing family toxin [Phycisphaerales bacterium]
MPEAVLAVHAECIRSFGGSDGVRDAGLLASAMARPQNLHAYGKADVCRLAAAYGHGIAKNHPFVDGNKRTAFLATAILLERNGLELTASPAHAAVFVLALADGSLDEDGFASWLRDHSKRRGGGRTAGRPTKRRKRG